MNRGRGEDSEVEPSEEDLMRVDLAQLQRKYRTMQNDYRAYKEATKRILSKQNMLTESLEKEQEELMTCMRKMETTQNRNKDEFNSTQLTELARFEKHYQQLILEEVQSSKDLDVKIKEMEKQITEQRQKMGGVHISTAKYIANSKRKAVLENRLDKAMVLFNQQLAKNSNLRGDIDHMRRERAVFDNLYRKLSKELTRSKRNMSDVISTSTLAFEQRDEAQNKMMALQERSDKERHQHYTEMKELKRIISHDDKIKEFMTIKASDRRELKSEEAEKKLRMRGNSDNSANADQATLQQYAEAFHNIQKVTGETDLCTIVENFIRTEDQNFALFNYVNELNSEGESLTEEVAQIKADIEQFKAEDSVRDGRHKSLVKVIENKYLKTQQEEQTEDLRLRQVNKTLEHLMADIQSIFRRLGCDSRPIQEMLGDEAICHKNVMIYMGLIEQRTSELLNALRYMQSKKLEIVKGQPPAPPPAPVPPLPTSTSLSVTPPSTDSPDEDTTGEGLGEEEEDLDAKPLTRSELYFRVTRGLTRRNVGPPQTAPPAVNKGKTLRNANRPKSKKQ